MGFLLTVLEAQSRLSSTDNLLNKLELRELKHNKGNSVGVKGRGIEIQAKAAALAHVLPSKDVQRITGYGPAHINRLKQGITSENVPFAPVNEELKEKTEEKLKVIRDEAVKKLMLAMGMITPDKLEKCEARDLSIVAGNMSKIVERTIPKESSTNTVNLVVYSPQQKSLRDFEVVEI